jgi:hypothetical protein
MAESELATLPEFTRLEWVSERARLIWQERLSACAKAWFELEWLSVVHGHRSCSLLFLSLRDMATFPARAAAFGLAVLPIQPASQNRYIFQTKEAGQPPHFDQLFCAIAAIDIAHAMRVAWVKRDDHRIGELLGYPDCCRDFFCRVWGKVTDTTWEMALNTDAAAQSTSSLTVDGPFECNFLLRTLGIRAIFHLPCSLRCEESASIGRKMIDLGVKLGFTQEMRWLTEMLSWTSEWAALHGIAEVKTPVFKAVSKTDYTPSPRVVRRMGSSSPAEGANGIERV